MAVSFCERNRHVRHGITESRLKSLRIFIKIQYKKSLFHFSFETGIYIFFTDILPCRTKDHPAEHRYQPDNPDKNTEAVKTYDHFFVFPYQHNRSPDSME